jgi:hypothetical protein
MEKPPRFEQIGTNEAGYPVYERAPAVKETPPENEASASLSRRTFLKGAAATAAAAMVPKEMGDLSEEPGPRESREAESTPATPEAIEAGESFERELTGYETLFGLRRDQVLFVDEHNVPVGEPQPFAEYVDEKSDHDGLYKYAPGVLNEVGIPEDGIAGEWLRYVEAKVQAEHPERRIARCLHVVGDFKAAYNEADEPALVAGIASGEVETYTDIVRHFSQKPVVGAPEYTREAYVGEAISFRDYQSGSETDSSGPLSPTVEAELRRLMPGLCAQESRFNNDTESYVGARGIFQFMPETWAEYDGKPEELQSLQRQVEIAGYHFTNIHKRVVHHLGAETLETLQAQFPDEASFERDLLVPLMISAYNAGSARVAEAARQYAEEIDEWPAGKDIFLAIAERAAAITEGDYLAAYGQHAREYVPRIYAHANVLAETSQEDEV